MTSVTRRADREDAVAEAAGFLAKRRVHDVDAAVRFDWTRRANRGTRETTGSVRRSAEVVIEGPEVEAPGPHLVRVHVSVRETPRAREEAVDAAGSVDAQNPPTAPWKTADGFPQAPTAFFLFLF